MNRIGIEGAKEGLYAGDGGAQTVGISILRVLG
jgi:hypothetical protein